MVRGDWRYPVCCCGVRGREIVCNRCGRERGKKHPSFHFSKQWTRQQPHCRYSNSMYVYIHLHVIRHTIRRSVTKACCLIRFFLFLFFFLFPLGFFSLTCSLPPLTHTHLNNGAPLSISTVCWTIWNRFCITPDSKGVAGTRMCV